MTEVDVLVPVGPGSQPWLKVAVESALAQTSVRTHVVVALDSAADDLPREFFVGAGDVDVIRSGAPPGVAGTLNEGLSYCKTAWVARLDADDVSHPERLDRQLSAASGAAAIGTLMTPLFGDQTPKWEEIGSSLTVEEVTLVDLLRSNRLVHSSVLFSREEVERAGGYRTDVGAFEDYDLWLRLCSERPLRRLTAPLVAYRIHGSQATRKRRKLRHHWSMLQARRSAAAAAGLPQRKALAAQARWSLEHAVISAQGRLGQQGRRGE